MENEREYLLKSVKTEQTASYDLGLIGGGIMLVAAVWFAFWIDGVYLSSDEEKVAVLAIVLWAVLGIMLLFTSMLAKKWIPQTEMVFFDHHLECKACPYSGGIITNIAVNLSLKYDQIGEMTVAKKNMLLSVSGKRYVIAAENIEECEAMLTEMKRRNANQ